MDFIFPLEQVSLPIVGNEKRFPVRRIYCVGRNYLDHIRETAGADEREPPFFFQKPTDAIVTDDLAGQVEQVLKNIVAILHEGGARPEHLVRLTWYVTDKQAYLDAGKALGDVYRKIVGAHYPAMTLVEVADLLEEGAKVEIEATAVIPFVEKAE